MGVRIRSGQAAQLDFVHALWARSCVKTQKKKGDWREFKTNRIPSFRRRNKRVENKTSGLNNRNGFSTGKNQIRHRSPNSEKIGFLSSLRKAGKK